MIKKIWLIAAAVSLLSAGSPDYVSASGQTIQKTEKQLTEQTKTENMVQDTKEVVFTDSLGREVSVTAPKRTAALIGSYADVWHQAGGTVCASAEDAWDDFEFEMPDDAVNLGMTKEPSLEKIFEAQPDFILASTNTKANMEMLDTLTASGIPTAYFEIMEFEDYLSMLEICTQITGRADLYEKNGLNIQEQIQSVLKRSEERIAENGSPKVLVLVASASSIRAKNSSTGVLATMLRDLGCINIADSESNLLENLNVEYILKEDPDYIFVVQSGDDMEGTQKALEKLMGEGTAWSGLTAVQEGRVFQMEKRLYNLKPNARWGEAYEGLERILSDE